MIMFSHPSLNLGARLAIPQLRRAPNGLRLPLDARLALPQLLRARTLNAILTTLLLLVLPLQRAAWQRPLLHGSTSEVTPAPAIRPGPLPLGLLRMYAAASLS